MQLTGAVWRMRQQRIDMSKSIIRQVRAGQVSRRHTSAARLGNLRRASIWRRRLRPCANAAPLFPGRHYLQGLLSLLSWSHGRLLFNCTFCLRLKSVCCRNTTAILRTTSRAAGYLGAAPFHFALALGPPSSPDTNFMTASCASHPS